MNNNFDSSLYPRTYTASAERKLFTGLLALVITSLIFFLLYKLTNFSLISILYLSIPSSVLYMIVSTTYAKTILYPDAIEYVGVLTRRKVDFEYIIGFEHSPSKYMGFTLPPYILYENVNVVGGPLLEDQWKDQVLKVATNFKKDDAWYSWMNRIKDVSIEKDN